jgi:very-short-patch-repair endonuclease
MRSSKELKIFSRQNKNKKIYAEDLFRKKLHELKIHYQRQKVIRRYIVDFYFPKRNLIVEIDGLYHAGTREYDRDRQKYLEKIGYIVLRFSDAQVENDILFCIEQILCETESSEKYRKCKERLKEINTI